jgi:GT2 family glycosyltransferase
MLTISIVSHGHGALVRDLLRDLDAVVQQPFQVLLTHNIAEPDPLDAAALRYPLRIIRNARPQGFGANHNAAFRLADGDFFCVVNPDVRLSMDPFPALRASLADARAGAVAPAITDQEGRVTATARRFPTPLSILRKALFGAPALEYPALGAPLAVDWVSGVFMLLRRDVYQRAGGFDERYFLYYEDVDLCARLRALGYLVQLIPAASAVHQARHDSHRRLRYMAWHLRSMLRFFLTRYRPA